MEEIAYNYMQVHKDRWPPGRTMYILLHAKIIYIQSPI